MKCADCGGEISATTRECPHCGSKKQFRGYKFTRKQLKQMGVSTVSDFYNFDARGGKIGSGIFRKIAKICFYIFVVFAFALAFHTDIKEAEQAYNQGVQK